MCIRDSIIRLPRATFFFSSSRSFLLLFTCFPFHAGLFTTFYSLSLQRFCVRILPPVNIHPIPLVRIATHRTFKPAREPNRILGNLGLRRTAVVEFELGLD